MNNKQEDITLEASLLKSMAIKKNYDQFIDVLDTKNLISNTQVLLKDYKKYYDKYNEDINWETFYTDFTQNYHRRDLDESDVAYYRDVVFPLVRNAGENDNVYVSLLERQATNSIMEQIENGFDEDKIAEVLRKLREKKAPHSKNSMLLRMTDVSLAILKNVEGITWALPSLQNALGSINPGQFWVLSADSDVGKSGLAITQVAHTLSLKLGRPVLYCDSEHTNEDLRGRILSNLYRKKIPGGFEDIYKHEDKLFDNFNKEYGADSLLTLQIRGPNDISLIEKYVDIYNPCLVVVDMIDLMSASLSIQDLTPLYNRLRGIANKGYTVIGTSQAGNTAFFNAKTNRMETQKHLTEKHMAGSKGGGKQGAAYGLIMIGKDDDVPGIRYVNVTKKKRGKAVSVTCMLTEKYSLYEEI